MKRFGAWSLSRVIALCGVWIVLTFVAFRWGIGPWMSRRAYDAFLEYARLHPEAGGHGIGAVSVTGIGELFLLIAFVPSAFLLVLWLLRRPRS